MLLSIRAASGPDTARRRRPVGAAVVVLTAQLSAWVLMSVAPVRPGVGPPVAAAQPGSGATVGHQPVAAVQPPLAAGSPEAALGTTVRASPAPVAAPIDPVPVAVRVPMATRGASTQGRYLVPIPGRLVVLRGFEPPPTPYAAGHRGVDLSASAGARVRAAAAGRVTFAGSVAGRGVVVIAHPDGIRTEYEPVTTLVAPGQTVSQGEPIGILHGVHAPWPANRCLHWGARRGAAYIDPLLLLQPLGPIRLMPWPR